MEPWAEEEAKEEAGVGAEGVMHDDDEAAPQPPAASTSMIAGPSSPRSRTVGAGARGRPEGAASAV